MDFINDYNAFKGVGGFDPFNMYKAIQDVRNALVDPYANNGNLKQTIAEEQALIAKGAQKTFDTTLERQIIANEQALLASGTITNYADIKALTQQLLQNQQIVLTDESRTNYDDLKYIESKLLENEMLEESGAKTHPLANELVNLGMNALLFGEMYLLSLEHRTMSHNKMDKFDELLDIYQAQIKTTSEEGYVDHSKTSMLEANNDWTNIFGKESAWLPPQLIADENKTDIPSVQNQIEKIFAVVENKIKTEIREKRIATYSNITTNLNDGTPNPERGINYGLTSTSLATNANNDVVSDDSNGTENVFPIFGSPYNAPNIGISAAINKRIVNTIIFEEGNINQNTNSKNGVLENQNLSQISSNNDGTYELMENPKRAPLFKGWGKLDKDGNWVQDPINTFTQQTPFSDYVAATVIGQLKDIKNKKQPAGSVKFFIEKLHGRHASGTPNQRGKIKSQLDILGQGESDPQNLDNRMIFMAYIDGYSENYNVNWDSYNFIGRGEALPIYKSTSRTLNLTFNIIADYSLDFMSSMAALYEQMGYKNIQEPDLHAILNTRNDWGLGYIGHPTIDEGNKVGYVPGKYSDTTSTLWDKVTFLAQSCYAHYRTDGKMKEQPIIRLRLADFYDIVGYIENLTVDSNEFENTLDLNPSNIGNIPFAVKINMTMRIIHDNEPNSDFYGFYHRKEFDEKPGSMEKWRENGTDYGKGLQIKSPLSFNGSTMNEGITDSPSILSSGDINRLTTGLRDFNSKFVNVKSMGLNIKDAERKLKLEDAMNAYSRVSTLASEIAKQYGTNFVTPDKIPGDITAFSNTNKDGNQTSTLSGNPSQTDKVSQNATNNKISNDPLYGKKQDKNNDQSSSGEGARKSPGPNSIANQIPYTKRDKKNISEPKTFDDIFKKNA